MAGRDVVVKILGDSASLERALRSARKDVSSFADESSRKLQRAGTVITAASVAGGAALIKFANDAGNLQRAIKATDTIFGEASSTIDSFARESVKSAGLSERAYREMAARMGAQLQNLGRSHSEAAAETANLITLSADLAIGFGTTQEAADALASLLRGERDPIERFGIAIKQADVDARLAAKGLGDLEGEARKTAEATATLELVYEQAGDRIGMYAENADDAIGQQQRLNAELENFRASIGQAVLPLMTDLLSAANDVASAFNGLSDDTKSAVGNMALMVTTAGLMVGTTIRLLPHLKALSLALYGVESAALGGATGIAVIGGAIASEEKKNTIEDIYDAPSLMELLDGIFGGGDKKALSALADSVLEPTTAAIERFGESAPRAYSTVARTGGPALQQLTDYTRGLSSMTDELRRRLDDARQSFAEWVREMYGAEDAADNYEDTVDGVYAAIDRLDGVQGDAAASARDIAAAERDVASAARDVLAAVAEQAMSFGSIDEARGAFQNARDDIGEMSGALEAAGVDVDELYRKLRELERKFVAEIEVRTGSVPIIQLPHVPATKSTPLASWTWDPSNPGRRAAGGPVSARQAYVVGEHGPELFVPGSGGEIVPTGRAGMGGGSTQIIVQLDSQTLLDGVVRAADMRGGAPIRLRAVV